MCTWETFHLLRMNDYWLKFKMEHIDENVKQKMCSCTVVSGAAMTPQATN